MQISNYKILKIACKTELYDSYLPFVNILNYLCREGFYLTDRESWYKNNIKYK